MHVKAGGQPGAVRCRSVPLLDGGVPGSRRHRRQQIADGVCRKPHQPSLSVQRVDHEPAAVNQIRSLLLERGVTLRKGENMLISNFPGFWKMPS